MIQAFALYGLVFLLGSFTVAAYSDLRRMAAQRDFAEVWVAVTVIVLFIDLYLATSINAPALAVKWLLIAGFALTALKYNPFALISPMDVAAVAAAASLLDVVHAAFYFVLVFVFREVMHPLLKKFGDAGAAPFLPVVWAATLAVLAIMSEGGLQTLL